MEGQRARTEEQNYGALLLDDTAHSASGHGLAVALNGISAENKKDRVKARVTAILRDGCILVHNECSECGRTKRLVNVLRVVEVENGHSWAGCQ